MRDLQGIDPALAYSHGSTLNALEASLLSALQSGAFLERAIHSKYDYTKPSDCANCGTSASHRKLGRP